MLVVLLMACAGREVAHEHTYTCPMHPTVLSDRPGACPVCGMDLVRTYRGDTDAEITSDLIPLLASPAKSVVSNVKTIRGAYKSAPSTVDVAGVVTYDTRRIYTIPARVGGRIEKTFIRHEFQSISRGQKIAEIYSPEMTAAQRELIQLLVNDGSNETLINAAKQKLQLLGMSERQIRDVSSTLQSANTVAVYSAYSGYVVRPSVDPSPLFRTGDYIERGEALFTVVADEALRIDLSLPGSYGALVTEGTSVNLRLTAENPANATVEFVQPFITEGERFLQVRVRTNEMKKLRIGELVNATIELGSMEGLWVPRTAVLSLGLQDVVFLHERSVFKPKRVTTGASANGEIRIEGGLTSTDEIAANAQLLVDSDSFIKPDR